MKNCTRLVLAGSALALAVSSFAPLVHSPAFAQPGPGDVAVLGDAAGTQPGLLFPGGETKFYVLAFDVEPFDGYEFAIDMSSDFIVSNVNWLSAEGAEATVSGDIRNAQVATGGCVDGSGANVLAVVTIGTFVAVGPNVPICIRPSDPTSFPEDPLPGYESCSGELIPFDPLPTDFPCSPDPGACLLLNPTCSIPVDTPTFSEIKARY